MAVRLLHLLADSAHASLITGISRHSVMPGSLLPCGLELTRLLCPWDFPGRDPDWSGLPFPLADALCSVNSFPFRWSKTRNDEDQGLTAF